MKSHTFIFLLLFTASTEAQVYFDFSPAIGHSMTINNSFKSNYVFGSSVSLSLQFERFLPTFGGCIYELTPKNDFVKSIRTRYIFAGTKFIVDPEQEKILLSVGFLQAHTVITPDQSSLPDRFNLPGKSHIENFGYVCSALYYFKPWLGCSMTYTRLCAHSYESDNFQSFLNFGIVLRARFVRHIDESQQ